MARKPFRLPERIVTLVFRDGPYQGLEVDVSLTAPQSLFWAIAGMAEDEDLSESALIARARALALLWGGQIRSWNLTDHSGPVPPTSEAFADRLDRTTQRIIIDRWLEAVQNPPAPLSPGPRRRRTSARS